MSYRQWYAQLDVYDTIRRYLALLVRWKGAAPTRDRLFISDFYLANPSLLHLTHMTADVRRAFNSLKIAKPDQTFLKYPSPPILYGKMGGIQSQALHNLTGKGLLRLDVSAGRASIAAVRSPVPNRTSPASRSSALSDAGGASRMRPSRMARERPLCHAHRPGSPGLSSCTHTYV